MYRKAHLGRAVGEPQPRRPLLRVVLLVFDLPAAPFQRGRRLALHRLGESLDRQAKAQHALGELLRIGRAILARLRGPEQHRVPLAHDLRYALAGGRADQQLVAAVRMPPGEVAGKRFLAGARRDAPGERKLERAFGWLYFDLSTRGKKRREKQRYL